MAPTDGRGGYRLVASGGASSAVRSLSLPWRALPAVSRKTINRLANSF